MDIIIVLDIKKKTISNLFYYLHIVEIPTNKGSKLLHFWN